MARINIKYPCGSKVTVLGQIAGMVTAVTVRGRHRLYECSYVDKDGRPTSSLVDEIELGKTDGSSIGFK